MIISDEYQYCKMPIVTNAEQGREVYSDIYISYNYILYRAKA